MKPNFKIIIIILAVISSLGGLIFLGSLIKDEKPNDLYIEMKEISDSQELVGLSKKEVEELLGSPKYEVNNLSRNVYAYNAGSVIKGIIFLNRVIILDCIYGCELRIVFDENDIVEYTSMQLLP